MKLKSILTILDPYTDVEIESAETGETLFMVDDTQYSNKYPRETLDVLRNGNVFEQDMLEASVKRVYYDYGHFHIEIKEAIKRG